MKMRFDKRIMVSGVLIIAGIFLMFLPICFKGALLATELSSIEIVYYASQIVSSLFVIAGVVIAGWQYYLSSKSMMAQMDIECVQRAIDLAEYYKDNILEKYIPIKFVYKESGVFEILNNVKKDEFKRFDMMEAEKILSENSIKKLKDLQKTSRFAQAVIEASRIYDFGIDIKSLMEIKEIKSEDKKIVVTIDPSKLIMHFMKDYVSDILNNIEFFSMHFSHGTADASVVYQSLHQSYIEIVQLLYYNIAKLNEPGKSKFFTNVIELYNQWSEQQTNQLSELADQNQKQIQKGKMVHFEGN